MSLLENEGFMVWRADAAPGEPFCIYPKGDKEPGSLGVELYTEGDRIIGVVVTHTEEGEVTGAGMIPYDRLDY